MAAVILKVTFTAPDVATHHVECPEPMKATIFTDSDGATHTAEYTDVEALFDCINTYLMPYYSHDEDIRVTLADGQVFHWNQYAAHSHYAKGRISFDVMLEMMKGGDL